MQAKSQRQNLPNKRKSGSDSMGCQPCGADILVRRRLLAKKRFEAKKRIEGAGFQPRRRLWFHVRFSGGGNVSSLSTGWFKGPFSASLAEAKRCQAPKTPKFLLTR
jgi:DNA-directed RNA polymerase subunit RPC12/RpoP